MASNTPKKNASSFEDPRETEFKRTSKSFRFGLPLIIFVIIAVIIGSYIHGKISEVTPEDAQKVWLQGIPHPQNTESVNMSISSQDVFTHSCDRLVYKPSRLEYFCDEAVPPTYFTELIWSKWDKSGAEGTGIMFEPNDSIINAGYTQSKVRITLSDPVNVSGYIFFTSFKYYHQNKNGVEDSNYGFFNPSLSYGAGL
jgi:hypothetical protein